MPAKKIIKDGKGISPAISTIIISGTLLVILAIASLVSGNVLELQIASTEFEQAKTNMMLLDEVIQDVALRRGAGGYVQFKQRSGGIGITEHPEKIKIFGPAQQTVATKSPSATTPSSGNWANPTNAYADENQYASITSAKPSPTQTYYNYGFSILSSSIISKVRVRADAYGGNEYLDIDVSWNGGSTWSSKQRLTLTDSEGTYWYDFTSATSWTSGKLNDTNFRVRVLAYTNGGESPVYLDWIPVEVTYVPPLSTIYESPNLISLVYRGGSRVSGSDLTLRGNNSLIVNMTNALSHLRVETGQGVQIKLDYHRVRIVEMGTLIVNGTLHNFIEITFLRLARGNMGGSETVNVKVQNIDINSIVQSYNGTKVSETLYYITIQVEVGSKTTPPIYFYSGARTTVVMFTIISVQISTA